MRALRSYPPEYLTFFDLYNRGEHFEAHETLEDLWHAGRPLAPAASKNRFYQGLIVFAVAWVHAGRDNPYGIRHCLEKARGHLTPFAPFHMGVDVVSILEYIDRRLPSLREIEAEGCKPAPGDLPHLYLFPVDSSV